MPLPDPPLPAGVDAIRVRPTPVTRHPQYIRVSTRPAAEALIETLWACRPDVDQWAIVNRHGRVIAIRTRPTLPPASSHQGRLF